MKTAFRGMFITDFDGTLLKSDHTLCRRDIKELEGLKDKGIKIVIATGRSIFSFDMALSKLKINRPCLDYLIFSTGAGILSYPHKNIIKSKSLDNKSVKQISSVLDEGKIDHMIHRPVPYTREFQYRLYNKNNVDFISRLNLYKDFSTPVSGLDFGEATEIIAIIPKDMIEDQLQFILNNVKGFNLIRTTSPLDHETVWLEIFPKNVSKSNASSWLAKKLNIDKKDILAVGNDYNDQDLLEWAGTSFIAENGPEELRKKFNNVPSNNSGAVRQAILNWKDKLRNGEI